MFLVSAHKLVLVHESQNRDIDAASVMKSVQSGTNTVCHTAEERDRLIEAKTKMGFVCHVFNYDQSFQTTTSVQSIKVA